MTSIARSTRRRSSTVLRVIARRLLYVVPIVVLVGMGVFALAGLSPLDPLDAYLNGQSASLTSEQRAEMREHLGLDQPWWAAWWSWFSGLFRGEYGQSLAYHQPVGDIFSERLPWTVLLGAAGLALALALSVAMGTTAALYPGSHIDRLLSSTATLLQAVPPFVLGMGVIAIFAIGLRALPTGGLTDPGEQVEPGSLVRHLVLPTLVFALSQLPWLVLGLRETLLVAMKSPAVVAARLRGIPRRTVLWRHVMPVAAAPFVALVATRLPELVAGSAIVESVFAWPGLGAVIVQAAQRLDLALLAFLTLATTALVLASTLLADVLYVRLDPRVGGDV